MEERSLSIEPGSSHPACRQADLRKTTSPPTSSESMIAIMTASTGVSLVMLVWRAEEPAAVSTRSPMPASTLSMATYGFPEGLPCSSVGRQINSLRPDSFSYLMVGTVVPMTLAISMVRSVLITLGGSRCGLRYCGGCLVLLGALDDLDAGAGADARGSGLDHGLGILVGAHAARGFDAHFGTDHAAHQLHIVDGGAAGGEAGGGFDKIGLSLFGDQRGQHFFFVGEQRGLEDDLDQRTALVGGFDHAANVTGDHFQVAGFERADVEHHVDFGGALVQRVLRLEHLHVRGGGAQGEADLRAVLYIRAFQQLSGQRHPGGVDAH